MLYSQSQHVALNGSLQDSCSPPSQMIPHPKPCAFIHLLPPPPPKIKLFFCFCTDLVCPLHVPLPLNLTPTSLVSNNSNAPLALLFVLASSLYAVPFVTLRPDLICVLTLPRALTLHNKINALILNCLRRSELGSKLVCVAQTPKNAGL